MSERNYYVLCDSNCKFPAMTKEQVLAAIAEATGYTPTDIDGAFITKVKEQNAGGYVTFWVGTTAEYNALETHDANCIYIKTDDTTFDDINRAIDTMGEKVDDAIKATQQANNQTLEEVNKTITTSEQTTAVKIAADRVRLAALEAVEELTVTQFLGYTAKIDSDIPERNAAPDTNSTRDCEGSITFRRQGHICTASFDIYVVTGKGQVFLFYENMLDIPEKFRPKTTAFQFGLLHDENVAHTTTAVEMAAYVNNAQLKIVIKQNVSDGEMAYSTSHKIIGTMTYFV